jgi:molybdate transport system substrate-binding protein
MTLKHLLLLPMLLLSGICQSEQALHIAVASSFRPTLEKIALQYQLDSGVHCLISSAATGVLYAQITKGAGFDILLAADSWRPARLIEQGFARGQDRHSYALGKLILVAADGILQQASQTEVMVLLQDDRRRIALANPATAPYGLASQQSLQALQIWQSTRKRQVIGQNAAQSFQFFTTGNADFAFVSLAQWRNWAQRHSSSYWLVPPSLYQALVHDGIILSGSKKADRAADFMRFLLSARSAEILQQDGYGIPANT